jgi:hypothetical protein
VERFVRGFREPEEACGSPWFRAFSCPWQSPFRGQRTTDRWSDQAAPSSLSPFRGRVSWTVFMSTKHDEGGPERGALPAVEAEAAPHELNLPPRDPLVPPGRVRAARDQAHDHLGLAASGGLPGFPQPATDAPAVGRVCTTRGRSRAGSTRHRRACRTSGTWRSRPWRRRRA